MRRLHSAWYTSVASGDPPTNTLEEQPQQGQSQPIGGQQECPPSPSEPYLTPRGSHASSSRRGPQLPPQSRASRGRQSGSFKHRVTFRKTPPPFHFISPTSGSSVDTLSGVSTQRRPLKFQLPPRSRNRLNRLSMRTGIALEEDTSRTVNMPGGATSEVVPPGEVVAGDNKGLRPEPRPLTASMTSMLARRDYFGPDILIILGVSLTLLGTAVTVIGTNVQISHAEIHMLIMGIGPSLVAMGLLFAILRLFFWRPKLCTCCGWDGTIETGQNNNNIGGPAKNAIHPEDTAARIKDNTGCGVVMGIVSGHQHHHHRRLPAHFVNNRSTLSLDASVLMAYTDSTNLVSSPGLTSLGLTSLGLTTPSNELSSRGPSKVNTPDDSHFVEASENEDNEMTESLINRLIQGGGARTRGYSPHSRIRDLAPLFSSTNSYRGIGGSVCGVSGVRLWNIPVNSAVITRPPAQRASSYPATPSEEMRTQSSTYSSNYHHYNRSTDQPVYLPDGITSMTYASDGSNHPHHNEAHQQQQRQQNK